jgi:hypothetical protein
MILSYGNAQKTADRLNDCLRLIEYWGSQKGLVFNPAKSQLLFVGDKDRTKPVIQMNGNVISYSEQITYLGVVLNGQLGWQPHIKHLVNKAKGMLAMARRYMSKSAGMSVENRRTICKTVIESRLTYAAPVWYPYINKKDLSELLSTHYEFAVYVAKAMKNTKKSAVFVLSNLVPIDTVLNEKTAMYKLRRFGKSDKFPDLKFEGARLKWYNIDTKTAKERDSELRKLKIEVKRRFIEEARDAIAKDQNLPAQLACLIPKEKLFTQKKLYHLIDFWTTQHLTGRGGFNHLLCIMGKPVLDVCNYCG